MHREGFVVEKIPSKQNKRKELLDSLVLEEPEQEEHGGADEDIQWWDSY